MPTRTGTTFWDMFESRKKPGSSPVMGWAASGISGGGGGGGGGGGAFSVAQAAKAAIEKAAMMRRTRAAGIMDANSSSKGPEPKLAREKSQNGLAAGLYVTATPIGNARDITLRALDILKNCDAILAEDTRVTSKLLAIHGISKSLSAYNDHNASRERPKILARLRHGAALALVSDAGTPLVSDPGYKLVREAIAEGIPVHAIPGASAPLTALALAGLPSDRFFFAGFLPSKRGERRSAIEELKNIRATLIFFESAQRIADSLKDMAEILGSRPAAVARELTKLHEEINRSDLVHLASHYESREPPKGEITLLVGPPGESGPDLARMDGLLEKALAFMPLRAAADLVADALDLHRRQVYERALELKGKDAKP
jgi:16S rRNA (cytidine1402-2'-O)-methyltransferase